MDEFAATRAGGDGFSRKPTVDGFLIRTSWDTNGLKPFETNSSRWLLSLLPGNYNWTRARSGSFEHPNFGYRMREAGRERRMEAEGLHDTHT